MVACFAGLLGREGNIVINDNHHYCYYYYYYYHNRSALEELPSFAQDRCRRDDGRGRSGTSFFASSDEILHARTYVLHVDIQIVGRAEDENDILDASRTRGLQLPIARFALGLRPAPCEQLDSSFGCLLFPSGGNRSPQCKELPRKHTPKCSGGYRSEPIGNPSGTSSWAYRKISGKS